MHTTPTQQREKIIECAIKKKIGEVLKEAGLITEEQLQKAIVSQKGRNKRLGKVLIELGPHHRRGGHRQSAI